MVGLRECIFAKNKTKKQVECLIYEIKKREVIEFGVHANRCAHSYTHGFARARCFFLKRALGEH